MDNDKISAVKLIRDAFGINTAKEIMACTPEDRIQLGSAIAREQKLDPTTLNFTPVEY